MTQTTRYSPQLVMARRTLTNLPKLSPPRPLSVHSFRPGDEAAWNRIICESFGRDADFDQEIRQREPYHPDRVMFADVHGQPMATATAWHKPEDDSGHGHLHMVGRRALPEAKGTGYWASLAALWRLQREGRCSAMLQTDDFRLPAIVIYLRLGFVPQIVHPNQPERWRGVFARLNGVEPTEDVLRAIAEGDSAGKRRQTKPLPALRSNGA